MRVSIEAIIFFIPIFSPMSPKQGLIYGVKVNRHFYDESSLCY